MLPKPYDRLTPINHRDPREAPNPAHPHNRLTATMTQWPLSTPHGPSTVVVANPTGAGDRRIAGSCGAARAGFSVETIFAANTH